MNITGRDWPKTLLPASYKGFAFCVDEESLPQTGREVAKHLYVRAGHTTEDMGRKDRAIKISAYLASDTADTDAQAFIELCSMPGPGTLVLPQLGTYQVRCTNCHAAAKKDELGRVRFDLDFIEDQASDTGSGPTVTPLGNRIAGSMLGGLPAAINTAIAGLSIAAPQLTGAILPDYQQPSRVYES